MADISSNGLFLQNPTDDSSYQATVNDLLRIALELKNGLTTSAWTGGIAANAVNATHLTGNQVSGTPVNGQVLTYNATSGQWAPSTPVVTPTYVPPVVAASVVGQIIYQSASPIGWAGSGTPQQLMTITLTPGTWDINAGATATSSTGISTVISSQVVGLYSTTASLSFPIDSTGREAVSEGPSLGVPAGAATFVFAGTQRVSAFLTVTVNTPIYLNAAIIAGGTPTIAYYGFIKAIRFA